MLLFELFILQNITWLSLLNHIIKLRNVGLRILHSTKYHMIILINTYTIFSGLFTSINTIDTILMWTTGVLLVLTHCHQGSGTDPPQALVAPGLTLPDLVEHGKVTATRPGKHTRNYGKSPFLMGKLTISMAMFNSYVSLPEGKNNNSY